MASQLGMLSAELSELLNNEILHKVYNININNPYPLCKYTFKFPKNNDYAHWLEDRLENGNYKGWVGVSPRCLYRQIIERECIPVRTDSEGGEPYAVNGAYMIANSCSEVIYIGKTGTNYRDKCSDLVVNRIIDHLIPSDKQNLKGNKMQNTPEIWDMIKNGETVNIFYCDGIGRLIPTLAETYLLNRYYQLNNGHLPMLNKKSRG
jgi:hypothetical protein